MQFIDITLSFQKYSLEKKALLINFTVIILTALLFSSSLFFIFSINKLNNPKLRDTKKNQITFYKLKLQEIKSESNKAMLDLSEIQENTNTSPDIEKLNKMNQVLYNNVTYTITDVLNTIEANATNINVERFNCSHGKINLSLYYKEEKDLMTFINAIQPHFIDIFILENSNNAAKLEITLEKENVK